MRNIFAFLLTACRFLARLSMIALRWLYARSLVWIEFGRNQLKELDEILAQSDVLQKNDEMKNKKRKE